MVTHKGTQTIETDRLILRRARIEDAQQMFACWASDAEVTKFLTWPPHANEGVSATLLKSWIADYESLKTYHWMIVPKGTGDLPIGTLSAVSKDDRIGKLEVGYCIGRSWWHKGIASEALAAVIAYLFTEVGANRIQARHDPNNPNSGAVMRKCGMQFEGRMRQADHNNQGVCDVDYYAILRQDYFHHP